MIFFDDAQEILNAFNPDSLFCRHPDAKFFFNRST
jgi:hypothetical protein